MKIAFVIGNYITPNTNTFGGAEIGVQRWARQLKKEGVDVSVIHGVNHNPKDFFIEGIQIFQFNTYKNLPPIIRNIAKSMSIFNAMKRANADIYHAQINGILSGLCTIFSKILKKKTIITMHALDCDLIGFNIIQKVFAIIAANLADELTVVFKHQINQVEQTYKLKPKLTPLAVEIPKSTSNGKTIVWIGRFEVIKQPELFADIFGDKLLKTKMIGSGTLFEKIKSKKSNIKFTGYLSSRDIKPHYKNAGVLVNTSKSEGFPVTWLEAWSYGVPVVSLVDASGILDSESKINSNSLGIKTTKKQLFNTVERLILNDRLRTRLGENGRNYVIKNHSFEISTKRLIELYQSI